MTHVPRCRYCTGLLAATPVTIRTQRTSINGKLLEESRIGTVTCGTCGAPQPVTLSRLTRDDIADEQYMGESER